MRRAIFLTGLGSGLILLGAGVERLADGPTEPVEPADHGVLMGLCEASTIVPWEGGYLVGDNEGETALYAFDAAMKPRKNVALNERVEDIEALAATPQGLWVVGSQSNNKKGEARPARARALLLGHAAVRPDLSGCEACAAVSGLPPKEGGLSVEGAAAWRGSLWLGLRSPLDHGQATLLRLEGDPTIALRAAEPIPLDLGGLGVRELMVSGEDLLVLAGPTGGGDDPHALYRLSAPDQAPTRLDIDLPPHSEGMASTPDGRLLVVTDGDGKPGKACSTPATWVLLHVPELQ